jgi:hypothetical protein
MRLLLLLCSTLPLLASSEVAAILEAKCLACHMAGGIAPMAFTSAVQMRPWIKAIKQSIIRGTMPPWHADEATSVRFAGSRALTANEKSTLLGWLDQPGQAKDFKLNPPPPTPKWRLGQPDLIVRIPGMNIPASGTLQYTFLASELNLPGAQWIAAAEWNIDQQQVVHHINAFVRPKGSSYVREAPYGKLYTATRAERAARHPGEREVDRRELLLGYEPGYHPQPWGPSRAKLIPAGADIVLEIHYTANGKAVEDRSELGLYFAKQPPSERVITISPADSDLAIPPGESNYRSQVTATLKNEAKLISLQPHMHLRGKAYDITLKTAGDSRPLIRVPRYDFNWQTTYFLKEPIPLQPGAVLECTAWFDNSPNNRFNPDPAQLVRWGDQSWEEMNIGFMELAIPAGQDPDIVTLSGTTRPSGGRQQ